MFFCFLHSLFYEPHHKKTRFLPMRKQKTQISFAVTAKLISAFVFITRIVQFLLYLYPKFQASSHLLKLYRRVCVRPGQKSQRPVFSRCSSYRFYGVCYCLPSVIHQAAVIKLFSCSAQLRLKLIMLISTEIPQIN